MTHRGGRQRTGSLVWTKAGWSARITVILDGERVRVQRPLGTSNKAVAKIKLAALLESDEPARAELPPCETFEAAARRVVATQREAGLITWRDRLRRLEQFAFAELGPMLVTAIRPPHIRSALSAMASDGYSRTTCGHLKNDIGGVLGDLWRDEILDENVVARVQLPDAAPVDNRQRCILTDAEFSRFMASSAVGPELQMMALTSRVLGGARTSDLHAWDWSHIDLVGWVDAFMPRPKTKKSGLSGARLRLPEALIPALQAWWHSLGRPQAGAVFPVSTGPRAGQRKARTSYATELRSALWRAGVVRPLPGWDPAKPLRKLCELQTGSERTRPVDFHSFRRAFNTGLARAGVNNQTAMLLAGHRSAETHQRYVDRIEVLATPEAALPEMQQKAWQTVFGRGRRGRESSNSKQLVAHLLPASYANVQRRATENPPGR